MANFINETSTLAELNSELLGAIRSLRGARKELTAVADAAGEVVADAYEYAGADGSECTTQGNKIQRTLLDLNKGMDELVSGLAAARRLTVQAAAAVQDAEARRRTERAKLGL